MPTTLLGVSCPGLIDLDRTFLPIGHMRQISRVTRFEGAVIEGEVDLGPGHWVFSEHFPTDPIFPASLMIEAAGQLVAIWAWESGGRCGRPRLVRIGAEFKSPVAPCTDRITLRAEVKRKRHLHFSEVHIFAAGIHVATVDAVLAVLPDLLPLSPPVGAQAIAV
ncbi:MAG: hypothetical protein ABI672_00515 [Vicinamibacteria bacterium]